MTLTPRARVLDAGRLIDATPTASRLGIPYPVAVSRALFGDADGTGSRRTIASPHLASLLHAAHAASRSAGPGQDAVAFDWRGRACWIALDADPDGGPDQASVGILDETLY